MGEPGDDSANDIGDTSEADDPLREQLLEAAARVFASKGYSGTKIMDIVREAGLSSGAVYGRFSSKNELLIEAVVSRSIKNTWPRDLKDRQVADLIVRTTTAKQGPLSAAEAIQLEAYVAARREPEVAAAILEARRRWRAIAEPLVQAALADGTVSPNADIESILYFMETVHLGLLLQRGAGMAPPDPDAWSWFIGGLVRSMASASKPRTKRVRGC